MAHYKMIDGKMTEQPKEKKMTSDEMNNNVEEIKKMAENKITEMQTKMQEEIEKMQEEIEKRDAEIQRLTRQVEKLKKGQ